MILVFITLGIHVNSINCHHNMYLSKKNYNSRRGVDFSVFESETALRIYITDSLKLIYIYFSPDYVWLKSF
jgi:hypothetical protein